MSTQDRTAAQARAAEQAAAHLFEEALIARRPADRALAALLRQRKEYGSRDRRLITESIYALFRWWGWLRALAPAELRAALERHDFAATPARPPPPVAPGGKSSAAPSPADWSALLLGAVLLENVPCEDVAVLWGRKNGFAPDEFGELKRAATLPEKARAFWRLFRKGRDIGQPQIPDLIPDWVHRELDCPRPMPELIRWLQQRPPLWLRLQSADEEALIGELAEAGVAPVKHPSLAGAARIGNPRINLYTLPAYSEGRVEIQDLASQMVGLACAPAAGQRWWDVCAGGGGKSLLLAQLMGRKGTVVATDIREYKLQNLRKRARRAAFPNIQTRTWDGKGLPSARATFHGVLVDAPCTCSGTWRRNPAARWSLTQGAVAEMAALQRALLAKAAGGLRAGGVLVYATCSFFRRENEQVVEALLADRPQLRLDPFPHPVTGEPTGGHLQIWPWDGDCDAMFVARFRGSG